MKRYYPGMYQTPKDNFVALHHIVIVGEVRQTDINYIFSIQTADMKERHVSFEAKEDAIHERDELLKEISKLYTGQL